MPPRPAPTRGRGRPPKSDGRDTVLALLDAAAAVCAERGVDGTTLSLIAERAGVHATAIYNHFESRDDLLYRAAVRALEQITAVAVESSGGLRALHAIPAAYLRADMAQQRRLIAEIHVAGARHEHLRRLLDEWHREWARALLPHLPPDDPAPRATVKALFLLLLGLCHVDDVGAVRASRGSVTELAERMARTLLDAPADPAAG